MRIQEQRRGLRRRDPERLRRPWRPRPHRRPSRPLPYRLLRASDAIVRHSHGLSFGTFWRQHMNYGRGAFHLRKARAYRRTDAIGLEPFTFYGRLLMYPARTAVRLEAKLLLMTLMFVSQVANALGFVLEAGAHRSRDRADA